MFGINTFGWVYPAQAFIPSVPVSASDNSGSTSEIASIKVYASDPAAGTYAGMPSRFATYSAIPVSMRSYAMLPYVAPYISATEVGSIALTAADGNSTVESTSIAYAYLVTDSGTISETANFRFVLGVVIDSGVGADSYIIDYHAIPISASDANGTTTEAIKIAFATVDNFTDVEASLLAAKITDTDADSFSETAAVGAVSLTSVDASAIAEAVIVVGAASGVDTASGSDTAASHYSFFAVPDVGVGYDIATANLPRVVTDQNWGIDEYPIIRAQIPTSELISESPESFSLAAALSGGDQGAGSDSWARNVAQSVTDAFLGSEQAVSIAQMASTDAGSGFEASTLAQMLLSVFDQGTASQLAQIGRITVDSGSGTQSQLLVVKLTLADSITGIDHASIFRHGAAGSIIWLLDAAPDEPRVQSTKITPVLIGAGSETN